MVFQKRGGRYGGNSKLKVETCPFNTVFDNAHDVVNIKNMPKTAMPITANNDAKLENDAGATAPIKIVAMRICVGQRPLHNEKLLVIMV